MKRFLLTLTIFCTSLGFPLFVNASAPQFPGGEEALHTYLADNLKYPVEAADNLIEGVVEVTFTVNPDGSISDATVERPLDPDLEDEAIRLVDAMPKWVPATDDAGNPVAQKTSVTVNFTLPE